MSIQFYTILLAVVLLAFAINTRICSDDDDRQRIWESAKRELARRTREYIKQNPISHELQSFIQELRTSKRRKRQDHNNMYAIKNGEIVPLAQLEEQFNTVDSYLGENFTVVPLIIPIPLQREYTPKAGRETTESEYPTMTEAYVKGIAAIAAGKKKGNKNEVSQESTEETLDKKGNKKEGGQESTEETLVNNLIEDKMKSTSESNQLSKVLEDVQNLIESQKKGKGSGKEGALCNVSGYWDSEAGGMTFHIMKTEGGANISMKPIEPPSEDGFIAQTKWNVTARIPFPQSAQVVITLTAHKGRRVALFLGECRVCDGSETITGDWLVGRTSTNCKDQKASHSFVSDILRKNNIETLREAHMKKLYTMTTTEYITEPG